LEIVLNGTPLRLQERKESCKRGSPIRDVLERRAHLINRKGPVEFEGSVQDRLPPRRVKGLILLGVESREILWEISCVDPTLFRDRGQHRPRLSAGVRSQRRGKEEKKVSDVTRRRQGKGVLGVMTCRKGLGSKDTELVFL